MAQTKVRLQLLLKYVLKHMMFMPCAYIIILQSRQQKVPNSQNKLRKIGADHPDFGFCHTPHLRISIFSFNISTKIPTAWLNRPQRRVTLFVVIKQLQTINVNLQRLKLTFLRRSIRYSPQILKICFYSMYQSSQPSTNTDSEMESVQISQPKPSIEILQLQDRLRQKQLELQKLAKQYRQLQKEIEEQRELNKHNQELLKLDLRHQFSKRQILFQSKLEKEFLNQKSEFKKQLEQESRIREEELRQRKQKYNQMVDQHMERREEQLTQYYEMRMKKRQTELKEENRGLLPAREKAYFCRVMQLSEALNLANKRNQEQQKQLSALKTKVTTDLSAVKKYLDEDNQRKNKNNE